MRLTIREEIQNQLDEYTRKYDAGDALACADAYAQSGQIISPFGPTAIGRDAVCATHREWFETPEANKRMEMLRHGGSPEAPWCLVAYSGEVLDPAGGSPQTEKGTSLIVWERDLTGELKILISSLNAEIENAGSDEQIHDQNI